MPSSTLCPTRRYRLALASLVAGIALALGIVTPAAAAVTGGLTLGSNTVTAGGSTTATATFNLATPAATVDVSLQIVAVGAVTGSATLSLDSTTVPTAAPCTVVSSAIGCAWDTPADGQSGTINATITTSADAVGTWELRANYVEDPGAGNVEQTLQSQTLTVTPAYTATFAAQSPSPAPPSSTLPSSVVFTLTGAGTNIGVDLEGTGGEGTLSNFDINTGGSCVATSTRGFRCDWNPVNDPDTVTITFDVNVGAGATPPDWTLRAILDEGVSGTTLATRSVVIEPPVAVDRVVTRIGGATRIDTAIDVSKNGFGPDTAGTVVLARSDLYPDALVGAPLAALTNAPLLLTPSNVLPTTVLNEINRVLPVGATVYVLGGTVSIEPAVETALVNAGYTVERLGGADRFETATKVADAIAALAGADTDTVLLASGLDFADALAASAAAAEHAHPVLLTAGADRSDTTTAWISANTPGELFCVGGPACAAADDDPVTDTAIEIVGATRYTTATKVAARFFDPGTPIGVASGVEFPDALAAAADTPNRGGPLLLTAPTSLPAEVNTFIDTWNPTTIVIYGGPAAVSPAVAEQLAN